MISKTNSCGLLWDLTIAESLTETQKWVLSVMQNHGQEIVTLLWRILGNEQDVCDAYQDAFLKLAHLEGRQKPKNVKAYIFRTASNVAMSMLRRKIVERNSLSELDTNKETAKLPENELDSQYLQQRMRSCIARLPGHLRNVIALHDLGELSYAQTEKVLGITEATGRVL